MPQRILERLQVGVVVQNAQSEILYVNPKACELLGLTPEQFLGKTSFDPDWNVIYPDGRPMPGNEHPAPKAIRTGQAVKGVVMGVYRPQTRDRVWILVDALPELAADGTVIQVTATFTNITAQIVLEQSLQGLVVETGAVTGEGFFAALVRQVAAVTGVAYVVVAQKQGDRLKTLGLWADGQVLPNIVYELAGTPCAEALRLGFYQCHANLQQTFAADEMLVHLQSQSYVGIALRDRQGEAIGNLCLLHREPLSPHLLAHIQPILQLFAQRAAAELERQLLEQRFQVFMDNLPALAYFKDAEGRVQFVNRYGAQVLGQAPESIVGKRYEDFFGEEAERLVVHDRLVLQTQQPQVFEETPMGIPCLAVKFPMDNGGVGGISIDIRDRKQMETALRESEERRRLALELTHTGSWEFAVDTGEAIWSDSHYRLMGLVPGSVPASYPSWRDRIHPADLAATEDAFQKALADRTFLSVEYRVVWPDGTERWVLTQGQGLYDEGGHPQKMVGVMTDITERKTMELALRERLRQEQVLNQMGQVLRFIATPDRVCTLACEVLQSVLDVDRVEISRYLPAAALWQVQWEKRRHEGIPSILGRQIPHLQNPIGERLQRGETVCVDTNTLSDPINQALAAEIPGTWLVVPLFLNGRVWGAIAANVHQRKRVWHPADLRLAELLGQQLAIALQQAHLYEELQAERAFLASIYQGSENSIFVVDVAADGEFRYVGFNPVHERRTGRTTAAIRGKTPAEVFPEIAPQLYAQYRQCLTQRSPHSYEMPVVLPGQERWFWVTLNPLVNAEGEVYRIIGNAIDISDRKCMELALRRSEGLLQETQRIAQMGSWEFLPAANRIHWSHQTFVLLGFDPTQPEPTFEELQSHIHPDDREHHNRHVLAAIHEGIPYTMQFRAVMPDGTVRHLEAIAKVEHQDGVVYRLYGSVMDISERVAAQQALAASEERYRQIVEMQTEFILRSTPDTRLTFANRAFAEVLGRSPEAALGLAWADIVPPEDMIPLAAKVMQLSPATPLFENHNWLIRADGQRIWTEWISLGIFNDAGELQEIQSVGRDVTAIRNLEHRLRLALQAAQMSIWDVDWRSQRVKLITYLPDDILAQGSHFQEVSLAEFIDTVSDGDGSAVENLIAELLSNPQKDRFDLLVQSKTRSGILRWQQVLGEAQRDAQGELLGAVGVTLDVHDRRLAELSLQESRERLQRILTLNQIGTWDWDWEEGTLHWNDQMYDLLGLPPHVPPSYKRFLQCVHPEDCALIAQNLARAQESGEPYQVEYRVFHGPNSVRWLLAKAEVVRVGDRLQRMVGIVLDITDRKEAELARQASEAKLQAFLNNSPAVIYLKDLDGRYQWVNREFEQVLQMSASSVCGQTDWDFLPTEIAQAIRDHDNQALSSRQAIVTEETAVVGDGQPHTYFVTKFPLLDHQGEPYALAGISVDITARKQAELELQRQKQFLTEIAESTLAILYIYDLVEQRNVFVNPEIQTVLGYTPAEVQALGASLFPALVHPDDLPRIGANTQRLIQGETSVYPIEVEYRMRHKDGSWRWLLSRERVFAYTLEGKPKQILGVATDITYLKEIQIALAESEARFRSLANNLPGVVLRYVLHPDGSDALHYISPGCERLWEVDAATALADMATLWRLMLPEDVPTMQASIAHSAQTLSTWCQEWRIQTPTGQQKWLSGIGEPQLFANGDVVWDTIILDITEQRRSRTELEALVTERTQSLTESQKFLRQQLEREKLLLAVSNRIRLSMELPDILDRTVAEIQELLQCDRVLIYKILEEGSGITIAEARVPTYSSFLGTVFSPEVLPERVQQAYQNGWITALHNSEGLSLCMVEFMHRYQIQSKLVVPLIVGSDLWGLVVMHHCAQAHVWEDWEVDLMRQLSDSLAIAIRQSELFDRLQSELQARRQAEAALQAQAAADRLIAEVAQRIGQSPYLNEVLDSTLESLRQFLQVDRVLVYRFLPNWSGIIECEAVSDRRFASVGREIQDPCFANNVALRQHYQRGEVDAIGDVLTQGNPCYQDLMVQLQVRAKLVAPILQGRTLWGLVIAHDCQKARSWTTQEVQLLGQVATQIGIAGQKESLVARLEQELHQKETLLKEVHHRVKNNLQIVTSLMRLQGDSNGDPALKTAFLEGQNRIQTMALIHERLYRSDDLNQIDAQTYFSELIQSLSQNYNAGDRRIALQLHIEPLHLGIDQAIPCGLIMNELVSNAFKYAFGEGGGTLTVALGTRDQGFYLRVADNGRGLPADFDRRRSPSLGLRLVERLVRQLSGKLIVRSEGGTDFTVWFP